MNRILPFLLIPLFFSCKKKDPPVAPVFITLETGKAAYSPGEVVHFQVNANSAEGLKVRYRHLDDTLGEEDITSKTSWTWTPPADDFRGYLAEVYRIENGVEKTLGTIAVDVSSDWTHFPRYGFLSDFSDLSQERMDGVIDNLNRHHINGLQYYDWHFKHHKPLAGTPANPSPSWKDIGNRDTYLATVQGYIELARERNMKSMFYNLAYGSWENAAADGVLEDWYLYTNAQGTEKDVLQLPQPPFLSDLYLMNPSDTGWQNYIAGQNDEVYQVFDFDGYHIDQLGNRNKTLYTQEGAVIQLQPAFKSFIEAMKTSHPGKRLVMNAVNQYGQKDYISQAPVDFLYTEVWHPNETFAALAKMIQDNDGYSNFAKNTVLAAYINYDIAEQPGEFNAPGVLLADAVIFAFGGAHLELGEHMLGKEYFPNDNLQMGDDLQTELVKYYDFLVAYQNLLRDGGAIVYPEVTVTGGDAKTANWPPQPGKIATFGREQNNRLVIHLLNFTGIADFYWRDADGLQVEPTGFNDIPLQLNSPGQVKKLWFASPDNNRGVPQELPFQQNGTEVNFTLPSLSYWDMVIAEY